MYVVLFPDVDSEPTSDDVYKETIEIDFARREPEHKEESLPMVAHSNEIQTALLNPTSQFLNVCIAGTEATHIASSAMSCECIHAMLAVDVTPHSTDVTMTTTCIATNIASETPEAVHESQIPTNDVLPSSSSHISKITQLLPFDVQPVHRHIARIERRHSETIELFNISRQLPQTAGFHSADGTLAAFEFRKEVQPRRMSLQCFELEKHKIKLENIFHGKQLELPIIVGMVTSDIQFELLDTPVFDTPRPSDEILEVTRDTLVKNTLHVPFHCKQIPHENESNDFGVTAMESIVCFQDDIRLLTDDIIDTATSKMEIEIPHVEIIEKDDHNIDNNITIHADNNISIISEAHPRKETQVGSIVNVHSNEMVMPFKEDEVKSLKVHTVTLEIDSVNKSETYLKVPVLTMVVPEERYSHATLPVCEKGSLGTQCSVALILSTDSLPDYKVHDIFEFQASEMTETIDAVELDCVSEVLELEREMIKSTTELLTETDIKSEVKHYESTEKQDAIIMDNLSMANESFTAEENLPVVSKLSLINDITMKLIVEEYDHVPEAVSEGFLAQVDSPECQTDAVQEDIPSIVESEQMYTTDNVTEECTFFEEEPVICSDIRPDDNEWQVSSPSVENYVDSHESFVVVQDTFEDIQEQPDLSNTSVETSEVISDMEDGFVVDCEMPSEFQTELVDVATGHPMLSLFLADKSNNVATTDVFSEIVVTEGMPTECNTDIVKESSEQHELISFLAEASNNEINENGAPCEEYVVHKEFSQFKADVIEELIDQPNLSDIDILLSEEIASTDFHSHLFTLNKESISYHKSEVEKNVTDDLELKDFVVDVPVDVRTTSSYTRPFETEDVFSELRTDIVEDVCENTDFSELVIALPEEMDKADITSGDGVLNIIIISEFQTGVSEEDIVKVQLSNFVAEMPEDAKLSVVSSNVIFVDHDVISECNAQPIMECYRTTELGNVDADASGVLPSEISVNEVLIEYESALEYKTNVVDNICEEASLPVHVAEAPFSSSEIDVPSEVCVNVQDVIADSYTDTVDVLTIVPLSSEEIDIFEIQALCPVADENFVLQFKTEIVDEICKKPEMSAVVLECSDGNAPTDISDNDIFCNEELNYNNNTEVVEDTVTQPEIGNIVLEVPEKVVVTDISIELPDIECVSSNCNAEIIENSFDHDFSVLVNESFGDICVADILHNVHAIDKESYSEFQTNIVKDDMEQEELFDVSETPEYAMLSDVSTKSFMVAQETSFEYKTLPIIEVHKQNEFLDVHDNTFENIFSNELSDKVCLVNRQLFSEFRTNNVEDIWEHHQLSDTVDISRLTVVVDNVTDSCVKAQSYIAEYNADVLERMAEQQELSAVVADTPKQIMSHDVSANIATLDQGFVVEFETTNVEDSSAQIQLPMIDTKIKDEISITNVLPEVHLPCQQNVTEFQVEIADFGEKSQFSDIVTDICLEIEMSDFPTDNYVGDHEFTSEHETRVVEEANKECQVSDMALDEPMDIAISDLTAENIVAMNLLKEHRTEVIQQVCEHPDIVMDALTPMTPFDASSHVCFEDQKLPSKYKTEIMEEYHKHDVKDFCVETSDKTVSSDGSITVCSTEHGFQLEYETRPILEITEQPELSGIVFQPNCEIEISDIPSEICLLDEEFISECKTVSEVELQEGTKQLDDGLLTAEFTTIDNSLAMCLADKQHIYEDITESVEDIYVKPELPIFPVEKHEGILPLDGVGEVCVADKRLAVQYKAKMLLESVEQSALHDIDTEIFEITAPIDICDKYTKGQDFSPSCMTQAVKDDLGELEVLNLVCDSSEEIAHIDVTPEFHAMEETAISEDKTQPGINKLEQCELLESVECAHDVKLTDIPAEIQQMEDGATVAGIKLCDGNGDDKDFVQPMVTSNEEIINITELPVVEVIHDVSRSDMRECAGVKQDDTFDISRNTVEEMTEKSYASVNMSNKAVDSSDVLRHADEVEISQPTNLHSAIFFEESVVTLSDNIPEEVSIEDFLEGGDLAQVDEDLDTKEAFQIVYNSETEDVDKPFELSRLPETSPVNCELGNEDSEFVFLSKTDMCEFRSDIVCNSDAEEWEFIPELTHYLGVEAEADHVMLIVDVPTLVESQTDLLDEPVPHFEFCGFPELDVEKVNANIEAIEPHESNVFVSDMVQDITEDVDHSIVSSTNILAKEEFGDHTVQDSVEKDDIFQTFAALPEKTPDEGIEAPSFIVSLCNINVHQGMPLKLEVHAIGQPLPDLTWSFDDHVIESSERMSITKDGGRSVIHILDTRIGHGGTYAVQATNRLGSCVTQADVMVLGKHVIFYLLSCFLALICIFFIYANAVVIL